MKLNNKGWGLSDYLIIVSIIIIALLGTSVMIIRFTNGLKENLKGNNNTVEKTSNTDSDIEKSEEIVPSNTIDYKSIEDQMANASIKYIESTYKNNISNNLVIVDYLHLLEVDSKLKTTMSKDNCNGYVAVNKTEDAISHTPFIKCDNYSTEGVKDYYIN